MLGKLTSNPLNTKIAQYTSNDQIHTLLSPFTLENQTNICYNILKFIIWR